MSAFFKLPIYRDPVRLVGVLLLLFTIHTWHDPDIWYHLNIGRAIWQQATFDPALQFLFQQPGFVNFYWLFQILVFGLYSVGGIPLTQLLFIVTWMAIAIFWWRRVSEGSWSSSDAAGEAHAETQAQRGRVILFLLALLSVFVIQSRISARPDILLFGLLFAQVLILDRAFCSGGLSRKQMVWVWILQILATNIQTYFILGLPTGAIYFLASSARARRLSRDGLVLVLGLLLASLVSPFGWRGWILIFHYFSIMDHMKAVLMELGPPMARHFFEWCYWFYLGLTGLGATFLLWRGRERSLFAVMIAVWGAVLSSLAIRNIPFVVLFSAPLWGELGARGLGASVARWIPSGAWRGRSPVVAWGLAAALIAGLSWGVVSNRLYTYMRVTKLFGFGFRKTQQPSDAADWLAAKGVKGIRFFNEPNYGGYLAWRLPEQMWFGDSRYVDPKEVLYYFKALNDRATFDDFDRKYGFQAVLLSKIMSGNLAPALWNDPAWQGVYQDEDNVIIIRRPTK